MRAYARKHDMLLGKESVLIAVSGGADSMALLEMVARLAPLLKLQIGIAHLDHELRGEESRKDATFVNEQARERGLKIFIGRARSNALLPSRNFRWKMPHAKPATSSLNGWRAATDTPPS